MQQYSLGLEGNSRIESEVRIPLTVSLEYAKSWGEKEAIRELISNAIDSGHFTEAVFQHGRVVVKDNGPGLERRDFLFGGGSEKSEEQIGQFREGLKLAMLVSAREGLDIHIDTVGFSVSVEVGVHDSFGEEVPFLVFRSNERKRGTVVSMKASKACFDEARELFLINRSEMEQVARNVFLPGGNIFVTGLQTATMNTAFSYSFSDKSLTNRDRSIVDYPKMERAVREFLRKTKTRKFIEKFLELSETDSTKLEFSIGFTPEHPGVWKEVVRKKWPKAVLPSTALADYVAHAKGYIVLSNVPFPVRELLSSLGVPRSDMVVRTDGDHGILLSEEKMVYPITEHYVSDWNAIDAIREIIANARDASDNYKVRWDGQRKVAVISDDGPGLGREAFIFGGTPVKGEGQIGQFRDGLKMAALVCAREGRHFRVVTKGHTYTALFERNRTFGLNLLAVYIKKNRQQKAGTTVEIGCMKHELDATNALFRPLNDSDELEQGIIRRKKGESAHIYINGMRSGRINAFFSYNLNEKSLTNRDRKVVDQGLAEHHIRRAWMKVKRYQTVRLLVADMLRHRDGPLPDYLEYRILDDLRNGPKNLRTLFEKAIRNVMAKEKVFIATGDRHDDEAEKDGWKRLTVQHPIVNVLRQAGMKTGPEIADTLRKAKTRTAPKRLYAKDLPPREQKIWEQSMRRYRKIFEDAANVRLVKRLPDGATLSPFHAFGAYDNVEDTFYILSGALTSTEALLSLLITLHALRSVRPSNIVGRQEVGQQVVRLLGKVAASGLRK